LSAHEILREINVSVNWEADFGVRINNGIKDHIAVSVDISVKSSDLNHLEKSPDIDLFNYVLIFKEFPILVIEMI